MTTKNKVVFGLIVFGAMVADANIYLGLLGIATGVGVFFFAGKKKRSIPTKRRRCHVA